MTAIYFCPYCGAQNIGKKNTLPFCGTCRKVFLIAYSRQLRSAPRRKKTTKE